MAEREPRWPDDWPARLRGNSLTLSEYREALFRWLDRRIDGYAAQIEGHGAQPERPTLDEVIAQVEVRRMLERFAAGVSWRDIKRSALEAPRL